MWGLIIGERVGALPAEKGIKMKLYMEILVSCCELNLWDPPNPLLSFYIINVQHL